ncbi:MAG: TetR/AcrR family transcriptional regulator [Deltaproteobacteria bacterium]|nr:TetR/AcrR family transcriptional regulator [Deltaproteobacteria bacterium]
MGIEERKEREKEQRRRQIIDAAEKVFAADGFSGATIENIAEEAELSPATLYLYFKNKDELYASLNLKMLGVLIEKMEGVYHRDGLSPEEKIMALEKALFEVYEHDPLNVINVLRFQSSEELRKLSPELSTQIKNSARKYLRAIAGIFEDGVQEGAFLDRHPTAFADIVWGLFAGLVLWEHTKKGFDPRKDFLRSTLGLAIEILSRGIKKNDD